MSINKIFLQAAFKISQSLGVIGGKPNLALYFIGCVGLYNFINIIEIRNTYGKKENQYINDFEFDYIVNVIIPNNLQKILTVAYNL